MPIDFNRYINRLKAKRQDNPAYGAVRKTLQSFTEPTMAANRQMQGSVAMAGGSMGARAEMQNQFLQQNAQTQQQIINSIPQQNNDAIDQQIMTLEMQRDQQREQQKDSGLKTALQVGGTALGAVAGTIVAPGAGTMLGAQIGAGLGQTASGFVGGGGDMGMNYANPGEIAQGVADTIEGISSAVSLGEQKNTLAKLTNQMDALRADPAQYEMALGAILSGNMDLLRNILDGLPGPQNMSANDADIEPLSIEPTPYNRPQLPTPDIHNPLSTLNAPQSSVPEPGQKPGEKPAYMPPVDDTNIYGPDQQPVDMRTLSRENLNAVKETAMQEASGEIATYDKTKFEQARTAEGGKAAYSKIFDQMVAKGWTPNSPELSAWIQANYKTAGTLAKFKKIMTQAGY